MLCYRFQWDVKNAFREFNTYEINRLSIKIKVRLIFFYISMLTCFFSNNFYSYFFKL